jgi:hypothetical protein
LFQFFLQLEQEMARRQAELQAQLDEEAGVHLVRPLLGVVGNVFARLDEKRIVARGQTHPTLVEHSALLRHVSGLEGEIPFFIFVCGKAEELESFCNRVDLTELHTRVARGVVESILRCWNSPDTTREVKKAWGVAVREALKRRAE